MKGNNQKVTDKYIEILLDAVEKEPQELGYEFGRWTGKRLAIYLEEITGTKLSSSQVRRILAKKNYVYIWGKHSLEPKQDAPKRKAFKRKLARYLKLEKKEPKLFQVWFWDESGFGLKVIKRKNWCKKGTRKKVRGERRRGRVSLMGGVRYSDKKRFVDFGSSGHSMLFILQLLPKAMYAPCFQPFHPLIAVNKRFFLLETQM